MPQVEGLIQNTPEWLMHRVGMCTGSKVADVISKLKDGKTYSSKRNQYLWDVVTERLTGRATDHYCSPAMDHGTEFEPLARAAYELATDTEVEPGGFFLHPRIEWFGASPDGIIGTDGVLEIKCPTSKVHLQYFENDTIASEYIPQMLAEMSCSERQWCDFVSYDNRVPPKLQLFIKRIERNDVCEELIAAMEAEVQAFLEDVVLKLGSLAERCEGE